MSEERTLKVRGMTCGGCEASVVRVLTALPGVTGATASHATGEVRVTTSGPGAPSDAELAAAIARAGFTAGD